MTQASNTGSVAGNQYAGYLASPIEPPGLCAFPIAPANAPFFTPFGKKLPAIARMLYVGSAGNLELTLANEPAAIPVQGPGNVSATWVFTAAGAITIANHGFTTGDYVMVSGGTLPTGLAAATGYYVGVIDQNTVFLASTLANAQAGSAITLSGSSATCKMYRTWAVASSAVTIPGHGFVSGDRVMVVSTTTLPTGLSANTGYWVVVVDNNTIKFDGTSYADAISSSPTIVSLSGSPAGILSIVKTTTITAAPAGYHSLCVKQVNVAAATAATGIVGLY